MRALIAVGLLLMTPACAPAGPICTEIGAIPGIAVTVGSDLAPTLDQLALRVCLDSACREAEVDLMPGSVSIPQGCAGPEPDAVCSASARPDGTAVGFLEVPALVAGTARVSATAVVAGRRTRYPAVDVTITVVFPNGPGCDEQAAQGGVVLDRSGLRAV